MAKQTIDVGASANAGGDSLHAGMAKVVSNFAELYAQAGLLTPDGTLTVYVSPSGSDSNDGLSAATPVQSIQYASGLVSQYYLPATTTAVIQLADGTYTGSSELAPVATGALVIIRGNTTSPQNVIVTSSSGVTLLARSGARYRLEHFEVRCTAANSQAVMALVTGYIEIGTGLRFGLCISTVDHMQATDRGILRVVGDYTIVAGTNCARSHVTVFSGGRFECLNRTISISGSGSLNSVFTQLAYGASATFVGTTYVVRTNLTTTVNNALVNDASVLNTGTGNTTSLPGTTNTIVTNNSHIV